MSEAVVVGAEMTPAGAAAVQHAAELVRGSGGVVHVVAPSSLHADRARRELERRGAAVRVHLADGQLEQAVCDVARAHDALVVTTAASATRTMQRHPPRGVRVVGDDLSSWSPPPAGGIERASLAMDGLGGAMVVAALDGTLLPGF